MGFDLYTIRTPEEIPEDVPNLVTKSPGYFRGVPDATMDAAGIFDDAAIEPEWPAWPPAGLRAARGALGLDLRHRDYPAEEHEYSGACLNHCYVATEAVYHLFGRAVGYVPHYYKHLHGGTHWWLVHEENGRILDPTEPQLDGKRFRYEDGRPAAFLTRKPSKRAAELIRRQSSKSQELKLIHKALQPDKGAPPLRWAAFIVMELVNSLEALETP